MSVVVWAQPLLATVEGPPPVDYSGFLDMTLGEGYADDPAGPLCGNPSVGFDSTRLTGDGTNEPDFENHWSMTDTSDAEENLLHRWFTGTDAAQDYGFFEVDPQFEDLNPGQLAYLECRWPALAGSKGIVDVRLRGHVWEVLDGTSAPYEINYSNQSDGWFDFQLRVYSGNAPDLGCAACQCVVSPLQCTCTGGNTMPLLFQVTMGASPCRPGACLNESCMQGYIDNMDVYRQWGKTLAYGLRHTLHDLPTLPIDCSEP